MSGRGKFSDPYRELNHEHLRIAGKLHAETSWGDRGYENRDVLSTNYMLEMRPCSSEDRQIGSDEVWRSSKTTEVFWKEMVFRTNLEQIFKRRSLTSIHRRQRHSKDWCVRSEMPSRWLMVAATSAIRELRSSSESTSHHHLQRSLDWTGWVNGLTSQITGPHTNGLLPTGPH